MEKTEGRYAGEALISEANGTLSREAIVVALGQNLQPGTVLGKKTANGEYAILAPGAADGTQAAAGVLYRGVDASAAAVKGAAVVRLAEVRSADLVWPAAITDPQKATALGQLAALFIVAR